MRKTSSQRSYSSKDVSLADPKAPSCAAVGVVVMRVFVMTLTHMGDARGVCLSRRARQGRQSKVVAAVVGLFFVSIVSE